MTITEVVNDNLSKTLVVGGRLDTITSPLLEKKIKEILPSILELVLDLSGVEYLSSAGLRVILATQKMSVKGKRFLIKRPSNFCMQVFDSTGMTKLLSIVR